MTRAFELVVRSLALGVMVLFIAVPPPASAQERPRIEIVRSIGHLDQTAGAAFSPDGARVLSADRGGGLRLWEAATGRLLQSFEGGRYSTLVAFFPGGIRALSLDSQEIKLWNVTTGQQIGTLTDFPFGCRSVAVSPDAKSVLVGCMGGTAQLRDLESGRTIRVFNHGASQTDDITVHFSPDGSRVLTAGPGGAMVKVWEAATGRLMRSFGEVHKYQRQAVLAISPDGSHVVAGDGSLGDDASGLNIWDASSGKVVLTLLGPCNWRSLKVLTFSRDGAQVLAGGQGWVMAWDAKSGRLLHAFGQETDGKLREGSMYAISPDGTRAVSGDQALELWDVATGQRLRDFVGLAQPAVALAVSPDGNRLLLGDIARTIRVWNLATGAPAQSGKVPAGDYVLYGVRIAALNYARDRAMVVMRDGSSLKLWDANRGQRVLRLDGSSLDTTPVALSADGSRVAAGGERHSLASIGQPLEYPVSVWDAATGQRVRDFKGHVDGLNALAFSPEGSRLASGGHNGDVKLWDLATGGLIRSFEAKSKPPERGSYSNASNAVTAIAFSPDGKRLLSAGHDATKLYLWDLASGQALRSWEAQPQIAALVFSADGKLAASAGADFKIQLWEVATGRLLHTFAGHAEKVTGLAFSSDSRRVFSSSYDGTLGVWNAAGGGLLATMFARESGDWLTVTPEGFFDASSPAVAGGVLTAVSGFDTFSIDPLLASLHRPDLVREKLAGDPASKVSAAAAALDLKTLLAKAHKTGLPAAPQAEAAPPAALPVNVVQQVGHSRPLEALAYSPNGRFVASGSDDNTVKLWDVETGREMRTFAGHTKPVKAVAFSRDGRFLASGSEDATLMLWDLTAGKVVRTFTGHSDAITAVAFSPDGRFLLSGADALGALSNAGAVGQVKLWAISTGRAVRTFNGHSGGVRTVAFSPDGRLALSGGDDKRVKLWDLAAGQEVRSFLQHSGPIKAVAFSPDGRLALSGSADKTMKLWEVATGKELRSFAHPSGVTSVAFTPDGKFAITGMSYDSLLGPSGNSTPSSLQRIKLWDLTTGAEVRTFVEPGQPLPEASIKGRLLGMSTRVALSPDGRFALSNVARDMLLWDVATGQLTRAFFQRSAPVEGVELSPDGRLALSMSGNTLHLWDVASGKELHRFGTMSWGKSFAFSPDGRLVLAGTHGDVERSMMDGPAATSGVAFSPDGRFALSGSGWKLDLWDTATGHKVRAFSGSASSRVEENTVILWDVATGRAVRRFTGHKNWVTSVAFSPYGRLAASGSRDRTIKLWDVATGKELHSFDVVGPNFAADGIAVAFLSDRYLLAGVANALLQLEINTGKLVGRISDPDGSLDAVRFSSDGHQAVSVTHETVKLWDMTKGEALRSFTGHTGSIDSVSVSRDGGFVMSGSSDGTARIWSGKTGRELARLMAGGADQGDWVTMTSEGFFSSSRRDTDMLSLVRGLETTTIGQIYQSLFNPDLVREALASDAGGSVKRAAEVVNLQKVIDSGPPPAVTLVSPPVRGSASAPDLVQVAARISDRGKGIGRIEWRVNGVTAGVSKAPAGPGPNYDVKQTLALDPGENRIEAIAYEKHNLLASLPARATINFRAPANAVKPQLHVLAIGINSYVDKGGNNTGHFPPLKLAVTDAKAFAAQMRQAGSGLYSKVDVAEALDTAATAAGLDRIVAQLAARISPRDTFVLFAAAHGTSRDGRFYLIPQDYQGGIDPAALAGHAIDQARLQDWVANRIKARRAIILLDTCESGALVSGYTKSRTDVPASEAAVGRLHEATGRPVLTAAASGKPAFEGYKGHGVFTYALMDALHHADTNGNGVIEVSELVAYVQDRVPRLTAELGGRGISMIATHNSEDDGQTAHFGSTGEDFPLVRRLPQESAMKP